MPEIPEIPVWVLWGLIFLGLGAIFHFASIFKYMGEELSEIRSLLQSIDASVEDIKDELVDDDEELPL